VPISDSWIPLHSSQKQTYEVKKVPKMLKVDKLLRIEIEVRRDISDVSETKLRTSSGFQASNKAPKLGENYMNAQKLDTI